MPFVLHQKLQYFHEVLFQDFHGESVEIYEHFV